MSEEFTSRTRRSTVEVDGELQSSTTNISQFSRSMSGNRAVETFSADGRVLWQKKFVQSSTKVDLPSVELLRRTTSWARARYDSLPDPKAVSRRLRELMRQSGFPPDSWSVVVRKDNIDTSYRRTDLPLDYYPERSEKYYFVGLRIKGLRATSVSSRTLIFDEDPVEAAAGLFDQAVKGQQFLSSPPIEMASYDVAFLRSAAGLFVHEAMGHLLESDMKASVLREDDLDWINPGITLTDKPYSPFLALPYDDEGCPTLDLDLVSNGSVVGEIQRRSGATSHGSARMNSHSVRPRMRSLNLQIAGSDCGETANAGLFPHQPVAGRSDGRRFVLLFTGAESSDGHQYGPISISGDIRTSLSNMMPTSGTSNWLADGGLCGKGEGDGIVVGAHSNPFVIHDLHVSAISAQDLTSPAKRRELVELI